MWIDPVHLFVYVYRANAFRLRIRGGRPVKGPFPLGPNGGRRGGVQAAANAELPGPRLAGSMSWA